MEKNNIFKALNEQGVETEYEILFTFDSDETGNNYLVYTDNTSDEAGNTKVFASIFDPTDKETTMTLRPIETEKEWKIIESILESLQSKNFSDKEERDEQ